MNPTTQSSQGFPSNYEVIFTILSPVGIYLYGIITNIISQISGMLLDKEPVMQWRKDQRRTVSFKIGDPRFAQQLNLQQAVKYGAAAYVMAAMLFIPAGICSRQYRSLSDAWLVIEPASPSLELVLEDSGDVPAQPVAEQSEEADVEDPDSDLPFHSHILQASQTYQVDPALIRAIIMAESSYNPKAVSHRGAQGLMQLMPTTAKWLGVEDSFDPALNIDGGVRYFKRLLDRFGGNVQLALAAYNAGSRYVRKYKGVPPFRATRTYIKKVLNYHRRFQEQSASTGESLTTS